MYKIIRLVYFIPLLLINPINTMDSEEQKRKAALQILLADLETHEQLASAFSTASGTSHASNDSEGNSALSTGGSSSISSDPSFTPNIFESTIDYRNTTEEERKLTDEELSILESCSQHVQGIIELFKYEDTHKTQKMILVGESGIGKTGLARVIAKYSKRKFNKVTSGLLLNAWQGSEANNLAKAILPYLNSQEQIVLFFDEIDAVANTPDQHQKNNQSAKVLGQLMDENKNPNELIRELSKGKFEKEISEQQTQTPDEKRQRLKEYFEEIEAEQERVEAEKKAIEEAEAEKESAEGAEGAEGTAETEAKPEETKENTEEKKE